MMDSKKDQDLEARIKSLEQQVQSLTNVLGHFAGGLDKVSQIQANQTDVIEGLIKANETQTRYIKESTSQMRKLVKSNEQQSNLLRRLFDKDTE